jgi:two-component system, OmpR family, sensor histidine kinase SenX3
MIPAGNRKSIAVFIALGAIVVALAVALNVGWIIISWRTGLLLVSGVLLFGLIITGVVLNTIFLVREIRRNEQKDAFINAVTHELKTPVASMRLYLQTLQSRNIDEAKRREFYRIMLEDSDRLMATIEQVLHAGRTSSRRKLLHRSPVDVRCLIEECVEISRSRHHLQAGSLRYQEDVIPCPPVVLGDEEELKAAVLNLIDNAVKYSGPSIDVAVRLAKNSEDRLEVRVEDKGVGIPEPELKRIFNRFYRIPGTVAARVKGTGLGLFIVQSIVRKHGGRAFAESEGAGRGSTFTIELPLAPRQ